MHLPLEREGCSEAVLAQQRAAASESVHLECSAGAVVADDEVRARVAALDAEEEAAGRVARDLVDRVQQVERLGEEPCAEQR